VTKFTLCGETKVSLAASPQQLTLGSMESHLQSLAAARGASASRPASGTADSIVMIKLKITAVQLYEDEDE